MTEESHSSNIMSVHGENLYTLGILAESKDYLCVDLREDGALALYADLSEWLNRNEDDSYLFIGGPRHGETGCGELPDLFGYVEGPKVSTGHAVLTLLIDG
jgi:hypothetical protein